mgnify:FL=1
MVRAWADDGRNSSLEITAFYGLLNATGFELITNRGVTTN